MKTLRKDQEDALDQIHLFDDPALNEALRDWLRREVPPEDDFITAVDELQGMVAGTVLLQMLSTGKVRIAGVNEAGKLEFEKAKSVWE